MQQTLQKYKIKLRKHYYKWSFMLHMFFVSLATKLRLPTPTKKHYVATASLFMVMVFGVTLLVQPAVNAKTMNFGSKEIMDGHRDYNQIQTSANESSFSLQRGDIGQWEGGDGLQSPTTTVYTDTNLVYGPNNSLFMLSGRSGCSLSRFDFELQTWQDLTVPPVGCGAGSQLVYDGSANMYYFPGGNSDKFFKYSIGGDSWGDMPSVPATVGDGAIATYVGSGSTAAIYLMRGNSSASLQQFNFQSNTWITKASFPTANSVEYGMSMVWDKNNTIYALSNYRGEFKKYSISTNTWANLPAASAPTWNEYHLTWINNAVYASSLQINADDSYMNKFDPSSNSWSAMAAPPMALSRDFNIHTANDGTDNIYTLYGHWERPILYRYQVSTNKWITNSQTIQDRTFSLAQPIYDGGQSIYYTGGEGYGSMDKIYKKDLSNGTVTRIGGQFSTRYGFVGAYANNALYSASWAGDAKFGKFDLASNDWVDMPTAPYASGWGSAINNGGDGYLYATFGGRNDFFRFSEASGWQRMATMPRVVSDGGSMSRVGRTIYVLAGGNTQTLMKYNMDSNTWTTATAAPKGGIGHGAYMTSDNTRYLYAGIGTRTDPTNRMFYRYDTTNDTWLRMADTPQNTQVGANAFYQSTTNKVWITQGITTFNMWSWTPTSNAYVTSGSWYSKVLDLTQVKNWQSLAVTSSGSGTVTSYTRTSDNGRIWSDWQQATGTSVNSTPKRYAQIKITLAGGGTSSPVVSGIALNYDQETDAPNIPSQFGAFDKKDGAALTSGQTYEHQHPYFSWGGASDGTNGSGVAGYYVYFGTASNADPVTDGNYQTGTDYTVSTPMSAGSVYYMRIKVKDNLGNISDAATYFSYRYFYISPPGSAMTTTKNEFGQGVNNGVSLGDDDTMRLTKQDSGAWATGVMKMLPEDTAGPAMTVVNDSLYVLRGTNSNVYWKYDQLNGAWSTLAALPTNAASGSSLTWDGGNYIYALAGNGSNAFYRYNIQNDTWETLPVTPSLVQPGSDMKYLGNNRIALIFSGAAEFYIYNTSTRAFTSKASPPLTISTGNTGSGIWYDGGDLLYVYFGPWDEWSPNRKSLAAYSIAQDSWRSLSAPSIDAYYGEKNLVGDGKGNLYIFGNDYVLNRTPKNMALSYNIASNTWKTVPGSTAEVVRGTAASDGQRYIYIIPSIGNGRKIIRYDTVDQRYSPQENVVPSWARLPWDLQGSWNWQAGQATTTAYDGVDYMYAIGANEGNWSRFIKRSVTTGETTYLTSPPVAGIGGGMAYAGNTLYYMSAANTTGFYRYNQSNSSWETLAALPGASYRPGSQSLIALKDGTLLAIAGNNNKIYKFTPNGGTGSWQTLADAPGSILFGAARYDGDDSIYVLRGNNTNTTYKYNVSANSWSTIASLPINANFGAAMTYKDDKIYAMAGNNTTSMYVYNTLTNAWQTGAEAPEFFRYGADFIQIANDKVLAIAGQDSPDIWQFNYPSADKAYQGVATHVSQPITIDGMFDYAGIRAAVNTPANTKVEFYTRSSDDGITWNDWVITDNVKQYTNSVSARVASPAKKYTQIKVMMFSFDNMHTPTVSDYALDYYFDTTPPSNPTVLNAYTSPAKDTVLTHNTWNNHAKPVFDWPNPGQAGGATDGSLGSNMRGYWVYVGTDPTANPRTAGVFVTDTEYSPDLTVSGTYYFRLQAVDMTGNVDSAVYSPFIDKFDNTPPSNPALIVVTPSGFTSRNNFTFQWPNGFDGDSGVAQYCYYTGALSGPFAVETCQAGVELADVSAAYQPGANVFYLRTKDVAGNYSTSYTQVSYYYSTDPPSPVTNLRAVPPSSEQNLFAFTWDYPSLFAGDPEQLTYCYSINILPTPINTTCTGDMFISAFKAATQQGTNIIYMVAKDESGAVNWNNYASSNFIANTVSPGIPLNLVVTDTSDSASARWSLTLTWDPPTFTGNGISQYVLERSTDGHTFAEIGRVSNTAYVDLTVSPDATYYYRVKAADNVDNQGGPSGVVAKNARGSYAVPPKLVSEPRAQASFDQATISWVTDRASTSFVYYGTSPSQLGQSKGSLELDNDHATTLTGLLPSTTYYYRVQSFDNNRSYDLSAASSQLYTFRTTETARIFGVKSSDVGLDTAVIGWETSVPTQARIEYGLTTQYGLTQQDSTGFTGKHVFRLTDLPSGTTFHYRIIATTQYGSRVTSDDYVVTTIARPVISNLRFQPVENANTIAVKVSWSTNVPTSSVVSYRGLSTRKEISQSDLVTQHEVVIDDLASNTEYEFDASGRDQYGNAAASSTQKWKSGVDTKEPTISNLSVNVSTMSSAGNSKAQMIISWHTDEPTTTQVQYGLASAKSLDKKTPQDVEPTVNHVVVISNLELAQVYRIQPVSRDISGNTAYGKPLASVTPDLTQSPLETVLRTLQRIFRF